MVREPTQVPAELAGVGILRTEYGQATLRETTAYPAASPANAVAAEKKKHFTSFTLDIAVDQDKLVALTGNAAPNISIFSVRTATESN